MLRVAVFLRYTPVAEGRELWKPAVTTFPSSLLITVTWIRSLTGSCSRRLYCRAFSSSRLGCRTEETLFWLNQPLTENFLIRNIKLWWGKGKSHRKILGRSSIFGELWFTDAGPHDRLDADSLVHEITLSSKVYKLKRSASVVHFMSENDLVLMFTGCRTYIHWATNKNTNP